MDSNFTFRDEYGFINKFACSRENYLSFRERYNVRKLEMERNWRRLVRTRNDSARPSSPSSRLTFEPFGPNVKKAIRQGIPSNLRPVAWYFYSGGEALRGRHPNPGAFYESLILQPKPSAFFMLTDRIKMDFRDILPTNELVRRDYFSAANSMINDIPDVGRVRIIPDRSDSPNDSRPRRMTIFDRDPKIEGVVPEMVTSVLGPTATPFMSRLYNVLIAFFMFRPRVEYCRAVCSIASILLLVIQDEEKTFWTLSALFSNYASDEETFESSAEDVIMFQDYRNESEETVKTVNSTAASTTSSTEAGFKYFPEEMFRDTSTCSYAALDGFKQVLTRKKASLIGQLDALDIPISLLTTTWFQSLFVDVLPTESSMRVLDAFIGEGFKILYRVALALFYINEGELTQKMKLRASGSSTSPNFFGSLLSRSNSPVGADQISSPQAILNFIKFMPKKQVDADVLMDFAFNRIGSLPLSSILLECKKAADVEKPFQSIRRFSQTPETKLSMETIRRVSSAGR